MKEIRRGDNADRAAPGGDDDPEAASILVVFDLDGTLVDTAPDLAAAVNALLAEIGRDPLGLEHVKAMIGDGVPKLVERALEASGRLVADRQALVERFLALYLRELVARSRPFPGVFDALGRLRASGAKLAVCTNKPTAPTMAILSALDLLPYFDNVTCGDSLAVRKPDPAMLRHVIDAMDDPPRRVVIVGDSGNDVTLARAGGVPIILVRHGYTATPADALAADAVIDDMSGLVDELRDLEARGAGTGAR